MQLLNPYLMFNGNCAAAFKFYESCFKGKLEMLLTHGEAPQPNQVAPEWRDKIMHARLVVGDSVLMGSDAPQNYEPMKGFFVSFSVADPSEAERLFNALSDAGTVRLPIQQTFWATRFGMVVDRFGTPWMINCQQAA
jgi:PhnB protein